MGIALAKTISLLLLIFVGFTLRKKIISKEQKSGIKEIILSVALPAMIFIGLQKISFSWDMLIFPLLALSFNIITFFFSSALVQLFKIKSKQSLHTLKLLLPSLAPGLSCFPFLLEYFGEETLANAAISDIGNKFFVLVVLYMVALRWHYATHKEETASKKDKVMALFKSLVKEPVNMVIVAALVLLAFGLNYEGFPTPLRLTIDRISSIMTPLVLMFIGISVKFQWQQFKIIFSLLLCRSALAFLFSAIVLFAFNITDPVLAMLVVLFPQSSCSFWPYAHMCAIHKMDDVKENGTSTFDLSFAMNMLALSLPFSTLMILALSTYGTKSAHISFVLTLALVLFGVALLPLLIQWLRKSSSVLSSRLSPAEENE